MREDLETRTIDLSRVAWQIRKTSHRRDAELPYGSKDAIVTYGMRTGRTDLKFIAPQRQFEKIMTLVHAINAQNPDWKYARELIWDLSRLNSSIFPHTSFYEEFLTNIGSIITQELSVKVVVYTKKDGKSPYGYEILQRPTSHKERLQQAGLEVKEPKQRYVNWHPTSRVK